MRRPPAIAVLGLAALLGACSSGSSSKTASTAPLSTAPLSRAPTSTTARPSATRPGTTSPAPHTPNAAQLNAVHIALQPVAAGLDSPVDLAFRPGAKGTPGTMYVVEQSGRLRLVRNGRVASTALDISGNLTHGNEQGFLGATFSPDGSHLYVNYTDRDGNTNVDEYRMRGNAADPSSRRRLLFIKDPFPNHNGGEVVFGPDGMLYIGLGDGGSAGDPLGNGQSLKTLFAKIMRINPRAAGNAAYTIPKDNPFATLPGTAHETWMWGLRNPWRFSFDRATGDVWIGDVGQNKYEEIDYAPHGMQGVNWGWNAREGFHEFAGVRPAGARDPIVETSHADGTCATVGGYVYRGRAIPALDGVYLYGDDCRPNIEGLVQRGGRAIAERDMGVQVDALTTFGEDDTGELYAAARGGTIYKIVAAR